MGQARQIEQVSKTQKHAEKIKEELQAIDDKSKADIIQRQAAEKALDDLKKAGAHIGYANANRHTEDAIGRLKGIAATNSNVSVTVEELNEAVNWMQIGKTEQGGDHTAATPYLSGGENR